ncbi:E3 ubiquitin-protein ligase UHRF1 [Elsinoe australis]|uniref:E3 ubiquitin-protein ligase UHRF1 n=1 Tax=Elsinoe australis TaxID=40998 RepID=A0A2P8A056_9PEZI|nr:E3 ubiquitin-protein ligase UHRF1 [Elsinoe australis]
MPSLIHDSDSEDDREYERLMEIAEGPQKPPPVRPSQTSHPNASLHSLSNGTNDLRRAEAEATNNNRRNSPTTNSDSHSTTNGQARTAGKRDSDGNSRQGPSSAVTTEQAQQEPFRIRKKSRTESVKTEEAATPAVSSAAAIPIAGPSQAGGSSTGAVKVVVPEWYRRLKKSTSRQKGSSTEDQKLAVLKSHVTKSKDWSGIYDQLIEAIHDAMFLEVNGQLVRDHRLLDEDGLQIVFASPNSSKYPFYIRLDAEEMWHKWASRDFSTDLMRGIKYDKDSAASIKKGYDLKKEGSTHGPLDLVNGQWWPSQLCLVRDGAHTSAQGGIGGRTGKGAWSVVMSSGQIEGGGTYPDIDGGDIVQYCGTDGKEGQITENTQRMLESYEQKLPVRLIRSSKMGKPMYKPELGFRYDGIYHIVSYEILDRVKQRHRFKLVREEGQDPIRFQGPERRPTRQELAAMIKLTSQRKFMNAEL